MSITTDLATDAAYVLADPAELHQVVVNIAANAVHAMRRRGGVLHITLTVRGDAVELVMRDEGEGMSPAVLERAVEPFFTTRPTGEGTGMGLAVAHGVVHGLGGTLALASREQVGTTVRVTLPHHRPGRDDATTTRSTPTGLAPRRVLVLDDDQLVLRTMTRILERAGHQVTGYTEPRTALMALVTDPGCADVIVTDLTMPGMTGLEFLAALRRADVRTPAIMCSGYLDEETARRARLLGVVQLFDKPVPHDQLVRAVESVGTPVAATG
ncbi:MAG: response regulator [Gemmatimonadaceae bacterium]|nr:response regulator [Gemmatimonadaceae bacterium]